MNLKNQIKILNSKYCNETNNLNSQIEKLNKQLNEEKKRNNGNLQNYNKQNNSNEILSLYQEINELNKKLRRYPIELLESEKLISVIFTSSDESMYYCIICKNTDIFHDLETKLYKDYPEYKQNDNYFIVRGSEVNRFKTLEKNHIKNSDIIILNKSDN